jgi:hypothetical protein
MGRFIDITGAPIASDFQEMPLDFMSKALDVKQKSLDTFRSDADKGLPVDTGLRTEWVKKYADETYAPELDKIAKDAVSNPQEAGRKLTSLRTKMAKDPFIAKAKQDAAAREFVNKNEYTLKQEGKPILDYRDAQGNIIQMSKEDLLNKDFDLGTWYDATGYGDYIKEIRDKFSKSLPEKGKYVRDILPGLQDFTSRGLGQLMSQGKSITEVDRREIKELNDDIDAEYRRLMNDGGKDARYFRKEHGLKQGDLSAATEDFVKNKVLLPEAKTFMYNWGSTVTDLSYSAPPSGDGSGKKPKAPPVIREAGTTPEQYVKEQYDRVSATNKDQIKKDLRMRVAKIIGDPSINRNDKNLQVEFKKIADANGNIDPDKLINYDLNRLTPYLAGNSTLAQSMSDLYMLQSDYSTLQQVDDEADVLASRGSGYTKSDYDGLPENFKNALMDKEEAAYKFISITPSGKVLGLPKETDASFIGTVNQGKGDIVLDAKDIPLANKYLKELQDKNSKLNSFNKIKKEEKDKLLKSALEKQSKVKYLDFNDAQDQTEFDRDVQTSIISNINNSADDAGYFTNWKTGKKSQLPKGYELDKSKYRGHIKTPDGKYKTLFSIYNKDDKELGVYTLDESPSMLTSQYQQGSIDPNTGINYEDVFDNISTSFSEQSKDSSNPESTLLDKDTRPVGYTKSILHNNRQVATMRIDNVNQRVYTLTPDIIAKYNKLPPYYKIAGKDTVSNTDAFNIDDVSKIVTIALANQ